MKTINLAELETILTDHKPHDFGILLNGGIISRKTIKLLKNQINRYRLHNHIDDTTQTLALHELIDDSLTNIGKAAKKHALILLE